MTETVPTTTNTEERPHAERSSSQLPTLALCRGYRPEKKAPGQEHWVTKQGLRGHAALETEDTSDLESGFEEYMTQLCQDYCDKLLGEHPAQVVKEPKITTIEGRWGYVDRLHLRYELDAVDELARDWAGRPMFKPVADVVDFKFVKAHEVTDAEINLQGKDYVVGVFDQYPHVNTIHVHFIMPRFESVTTATFTRDQLPQLKLEILAILTRAKGTDSKRFRGAGLNPHYEACRFCGAKSSCKALRKIADTIGRQYDPTGYGALPPIPEQTHASMVDDPKTLGQLKILAAVMGPWADAVNHHALLAAIDKNIVPEGYAIDYRGGKRRVTDASALLLVAKEFQIPVDELIAAATVSIGALEKVVMDGAPRGKKSKRKNAFLDRLREFDALEKGPETPTLVRS